MTGVTSQLDEVMIAMLELESTPLLFKWVMTLALIGVASELSHSEFTTLGVAISSSQVFLFTCKPLWAVGSVSTVDAFPD
jgi:hypothetical protein